MIFDIADHQTVLIILIDEMAEPLWQGEFSFGERALFVPVLTSADLLDKSVCNCIN